MGTNDREKKEEIYRDVETDGITENVAGEQTIQTEETKILKGKNGKKDKEVLIGKEIEKVAEIEEGYDTLQNRIIQKLMK